MQIAIHHAPGCARLASTQALVVQVLDTLDVTAQVHTQATLDSGTPIVVVDGLPSPSEPPLPRWWIEASVLRALSPRHVLFLCVANSARSQLAEGIARELVPPDVRVSSAGSRPGRIRPEAVATLAGMGLDASQQRAKGLDAIDLDSVDAVITLCHEQVCPVFPRLVTRLHWGLPDPAGRGLAAFTATANELHTRLSVVWAPTP